VDMTEEMEKEVIELAASAMLEFPIQTEAAKHIKKELDTKHR
jgi:hypothetical protein